MAVLLCACLQVISSWFHSDEKLIPFEMFAGSGRPASRKELIEQLELSDLIRLHQDPVGNGTTTGAANLIRQQLDRAVEDSVIVRLKNAISAVIEQPNHAPVFDGPPEQRIRLQQHPQPFWRGFRLAGTDNGDFWKSPYFLREMVNSMTYDAAKVRINSARSLVATAFNSSRSFAPRGDSTSTRQLAGAPVFPARSSTKTGAASSLLR